MAQNDKLHQQLSIKVKQKLSELPRIGLVFAI